MAEDEKRDNYSADNIQVLEGLEAVRKRPAMYIGDTGIKGLHHLVYEVVDNSIDEALAGYCNRINVLINEDNSITVTDNGRGIPTAMHTKEKKSALEVVMTVLHAGGKFDKDTYKVSGGLHGVGVSCVNALSIHLIATVRRDGQIFQQEYNIGKPMYDVKVVGESTETGTEVTFTPDPTIFEFTEYNFDTIAARMRELAFLNKGITITLTDKRQLDENGTHPCTTYFSEGGLREFATYLDRNREALISDVIYFEGEREGILKASAKAFQSKLHSPTILLTQRISRLTSITSTPMKVVPIFLVLDEDLPTRSKNTPLIQVFLPEKKLK